MEHQINVTRSLMPSIDEYMAEIRELWDSHWLTNMGAKHQQLKKELLKYLQISQMTLFSNGHMALELAIQALELTGEVITTPFTFASTTHALVRNGLTPVFCDVNPMDYTIDVSQIEALITARTSAIVPVHVYGNVCDVDAIRQIADRHGLKVIYDAAHTFGETYRGVGVGSFGDASVFSFHATKVFNTIEGGAVCYHDEEYGRRLYQLKNFGIRDAETVDAIGANAKMNEFEAAMGICNLRYIDAEIKKRARVAQHYRERLDGIKGLQLNQVQKDVVSNYAYFPIFIDPTVFGADRDDVQQHLKEQGIFARKYFYPLTSQFDCYRGRFDIGETQNAKRLSEQVLTLPMYGELKMAQVDQICDIILQARG